MPCSTLRFEAKICHGHGLFIVVDIGVVISRKTLE
jgi:hypothetical protein